MGLVISPRGYHMVILPKEKEREIKKVLEEHYVEDLAREDRKLKPFSDKINSYLNGGRVEFKGELDISGATPFEMKVWDIAYGIPYGEVRSYAWVAEKIGNPKEVRAVGQALKRNRLPIVIPCHRVIKKSGELGGFSGGLDLKHELLKIEGRIW